MSLTFTLNVLFPPNAKYWTLVLYIINYKLIMSIYCSSLLLHTNPVGPLHSSCEGCCSTVDLLTLWLNVVMINSGWKPLFEPQFNILVFLAAIEININLEKYCWLWAQKLASPLEASWMVTVEKENSFVFVFLHIYEKNSDNRNVVTCYCSEAVQMLCFPVPVRLVHGSACMSVRVC